MSNQFYQSGNTSGFKYEKPSNSMSENNNQREATKNQREGDEDLIIEENTVYEIDRECYERLKRQKKRKG
ncbi:MAG: hypothetical protein ACYDEX_12865 [Mobilitalea sp.]